MFVDWQVKPDFIVNFFSRWAPNCVYASAKEGTCFSFESMTTLVTWRQIIVGPVGCVDQMVLNVFIHLEGYKRWLGKDLT